MGTLYLVATPIGNLEDITLRALRVLGEVDLIAAEDTRRSRVLLDHYDVSTPIVSYFEHNKLSRKDQILQTLNQGDVALISDAGTPGLSDPGYELVAAAWEAGHKVSPIPGPSSPIAALTASGLPTDTFLYLGYLPRRAGERRKFLQALREEPRTLVAFEVPHRIRSSLDDLVEAFGPDRPAALARELTKVHEEILRGPLGELRSHFAKVEPRGEFTLILGGTPKETRWEEAAVRSEVARRLAEGLRPSQAAREVAAEAGWSRQEVYRLAMEES